MLREAQELARQENRTMSELVREALRHYQRQRRWESITEFGRASAASANVKNEEDVVQAIHAFRATRKRESKKRVRSAR